MIKNPELKGILGLQVLCLIEPIAIAVISADGIVHGTTFVQCVIAADWGIGVTAIVPFGLKIARILAFVASRHISGAAK